MKSNNQKTMPCNIEAEIAILGGVLIDPDSISKIADVITPDMFYKEAHKKIYQLIFDLYENNDPIDVVTVANLAKDKGLMDDIGGYTYLNRLIDDMPTSAGIMGYANIVREKAFLRSIIDMAVGIQEKGYSAGENIEHLVQGAEKIFQAFYMQKTRSDFYHVKDIARNVIGEIENRYKNKGKVIGIPTGFYDLDKLTSGLQPSDLIIIAARPAMGKTALALNIAQNIAVSNENPIPVGIISMEMSKEQLMLRLYSTLTKIDHYRLKTGNLDSEDWQKLAVALKSINESKLYIDDSPSLDIHTLKAKIRRLKSECDVKLVIIDYLQLMHSKTYKERRELEIAEISRSLKALAKELDIPIVALSQLNRQVEYRENKRPKLADLRESGAIEQDADIVMFLYRDEVYNKDDIDNHGTAELIIEKHRNGSIGTVDLAFDDKTITFLNERR